MLTITVGGEDFVVVGDTVIFFTRHSHGNRLRASIDADREAPIFRTEIVRRKLIDAGFLPSSDNNTWIRAKKVYTLREAWNESQREQMDGEGGKRSA